MIKAALTTTEHHAAIRLGRAEFTARWSKDTARFRRPASRRATRQDLWYALVHSTDQGARIGEGRVKSESLDKGSRMRRTPEQSPVSTPEGPHEWDDPTTVDVVGDVQFIGVVLLGRDHAGG